MSCITVHGMNVLCFSHVFTLDTNDGAVNILMTRYKYFLMVDTKKSISGSQVMYIFNLKKNAFHTAIPVHILFRKYLYPLPTTIIDIIKFRNFSQNNILKIFNLHSYPCYWNLVSFHIFVVK